MKYSITFLAFVFLSSLRPVPAQQPAEVFIPAGSFVMGGKSISKSFFKRHPQYNTADESPQHPTRLTKPFYLGTTEVTVAQFRRFVDETNYQTTAEKNGKGIRGFDPRNGRGDRKFAFSQKPGFTWKSPGFAQQDDHPVVGVSWEDAQAYCRWLSQKTDKKYRLPTEAEWEYACRAGTDTFFAWGDDFDAIHQKANVGNVELEKAHPGLAIVQWLFDVERDSGDPHVTTAKVGSYPANAWKLHDMHGNVWEWCQDNYLDTEYTQYKRPGYDRPLKMAIDSIGKKAFNDFGDWRVIRGGSWFTSPVQCRSAVRSYFDALEAACYIGFRIAREASATEVAAARKTFEEEQAARSKVEEVIGGFRSREGPDTRAEFRQPPDRDITRLLPKLPEVTQISINGNGRLNGEVLQDLAAMPRLRALSIHNPGESVTDAHFEPFAEKTGLEELQVSFAHHLTDEMLANFVGHKQLRVLNIESRKVTDLGLRLFANASQLEHLHFSGTQSKGEVLHDMKSLPLKSIRMEGMSDETAASLAAFPNLRNLTCRRGTMTDVGLQHLKGLTKLEQLDLGSCDKIEDEGFQALAELRMLRSLSLEKTQAGDLAVASMSRMQQLDRLRIGGPRLSNQSLRGICEILTLTSLQLDRQTTEVTDRGFVDFWRLNRLNELTIESPNVTGAGFAPLTELSLRHLRMQNAALTDQGLAFISEMTNLQTLTIGTSESGPPAITDDGFLLLKDATKLRSFEFTRKGTNVSDAAVEELKKALPNCRINVR